MKVFNSIGHFFATVVQKLLAAEPKVDAVGQKIAGSAQTVEAVSALVPVYGPLAVTVEKAGYAVIGEAIAVFHALGDAANAKFSDLGFDSKVVETIKAIATDPTVVRVAKLL